VTRPNGSRELEKVQRHAILAAFGVEADINGWARLGGSVVIDPKATLTLCYSEPALLPSRPQRAGPVYTTQLLTVVEKIAPEKTTTRAVDLVRFVPLRAFSKD
jgi:hypothetical protein